MGPLGKIAAFFSSNTSLHKDGPSAKELKKAANAAQLAIKRRNRRNEWYYGEAGVPQQDVLGGSSEDVHRGKFHRRNPVWSSLRDLRSGRRNVAAQHVDVPRIPTEALSRAPSTTLPRTPSDALPPKVPSTTLPRAPSDALPKVPSTTLPRAPSDALLPKVPSTTLPRAPSDALPKVPSTTLPRAPYDALPKVPSTTLPRTPSDALPRVPSTTLPRAPAAEAPAAVRVEARDGAVQVAHPQLPPSGQQHPAGQVHQTGAHSLGGGLEPVAVQPQAVQEVADDVAAPKLSNGSDLHVDAAEPGPQAPQVRRAAAATLDRPTSPAQAAQAALLSDDHNGRLEPVAKQTQQNGVSAAPLPARRNLTGSLRPSPAAAPQGPSPQEVAAELRKRLLPDLRHNAAAFEAMAVLLDYTTTKLGAFAVPALRRDLEKTKTNVASTVAQLEEVREQRRILERERDEEREARAEQEERSRALEAAAREREEELQRRLAGHTDELDTLRTAHAGEVATLRGQMDASALEAADAVAVATRGLREEYELELDRVTRRHEETLRAALGATRAEAEREAAQLGQEATRREAELAAQLAATGAAHEALREQSRRVMDSMKSDKDARTQALAARCRELQDEVDSLRSVLELRCDELQKSRRENDALRIAADQLPGAEQRISTLTARLEDLQVQLDRKGELEGRLVQENSELHQSFSKEIKEKQMLSLQNEQLQFKLKQNTEVVNALAANMSDFHDVSAILNASMNGVSLPGSDRSRRSTTKSNNNNNRGVASPPESPRVKGVVEKSESVSYMLEMEADSTDDVVARIYRRMASTPMASPAHAPHAPQSPHPRSAPPSSRRSNPLAALQATQQQMCPLAQSASATTITSPSRPTPKQRTMSATLRVRSRSISSDSGECLSSGNWSPPASLPPSQQQQQRLQRRSPDVVDEGLLAPSSGIGYDCSDIEDFSSSKSSSMSCSSESSELGGAKEHDHHVGEEEDVDDDDAEQPMFQHQQDLMTASCGSVTLPKDAGGEAMICSEEMNEDEVSTNGLHSSCEEDASCSEDDDSRGGGAGAGRARAGLAGLPRLSLPMTPTAGCGQSAINTPMDSSWSEDMELPVSLSETT